jgi:hypothetical protein
VTLTLEQLCERTGRKPDLLGEVLRDEQRLGRILVEGGAYRLAPGALEPELVTALELLLGR